MSGRTLYCLGEAWLELESPASLSSAEAFRPRVGGSAAALALAYAALGGRAALLGQLGEDAFGHRIADTLADAGVDVRRLCFTSRAPTPLLFRGSGGALPCRIRSADLLYSAGQLGEGWAADAGTLALSSACLVDSPCRFTHLSALDTAHASGVPVCFVPALRPALWPSEKTLRDTACHKAGAFLLQTAEGVHAFTRAAHAFWPGLSAPPEELAARLLFRLDAQDAALKKLMKYSAAALQTLL